MPGRLMSIRTTSGNSPGISLRAVSALANSPTSLKPAARLINADRLLRIPSSSSTMATLICIKTSIWKIHPEFHARSAARLAGEAEGAADGGGAAAHVFQAVTLAIGDG